MVEMKEKIFIFNFKTVLLVVIDIICMLVSYSLALWVRFDFRFGDIPEEYLEGFKMMMIPMIILTIIVYFFCKLYQSVWRLASVAEVEKMIIAQAILIPVYVALGMFFVSHGYSMPISFYCIGYVLMFVLTTGSRFSYRLLRHWSRSHSEVKDVCRIMVIGAGAAGQALIKEYITNADAQGKVVCIIDDNPAKKGKYLEGVPIVGNRYSIPGNVEKYQVDEILFAVANISGSEKKDILDICKITGCKMMVIPSLGQLVDGKVSVSKMRQVDIEDLLGREPQKINSAEILKTICYKVVMVTGGGGSIGSELCRQIASVNPRMLIIFDIYENNAYEIQQELIRTYPDLKLKVLIGSMRNRDRVNSIMQTYHPQIVFHAAAHKHVPLMEESPNEAIKNNVFGTYWLCKAALENHVERLVMISTDKAVNPTNIMGASKRLCEMIIQSMDGKGKTEFVAVRFGNVLGSNGSVVPLFKKQIAEGGPVTVTDPRIIRYFMTIPEAVSLVLQASYYAKGGEIFVLDMGEPVKIDDMARNLIRLSGYVPDVDIKIEYTGLRPGEKLYEELLMAEEGLTATEHDRIHVAEPMEINEAELREKMKKLYDACYNEDPNIREIVKDIVPTYHPAAD